MLLANCDRLWVDKADIAAGTKQAYAYMNNTFFQESKYFIAYMNMREQQTVVLRDVYKKIVSLGAVLPQTKQVAVLICEVAVSFGESNNARELLIRLSEVLRQMKDSPLPVTREEFEDRAVLYGILMDLEYFLQLKKEFADGMTQEQVRRYWGTGRNQSNSCVYGADQAKQTELIKE